MHPRLFANGFQYFVKRTVQREGGAPLVVQNNWIAGAENKRHRFREARLWGEDDDAIFDQYAQMCLDEYVAQGKNPKPIELVMKKIKQQAD